MDIPVNQQELTYKKLCANTGYSVEDLPKVIGTDGEESQGNTCDQPNLMLMIIYIH